MALIEVLLQLDVVKFEIRFFQTIIYMVCCLIIFIFKDEYLLILCYKYF